MPGISAHKIGMPFAKKGFKWSTYWATLISATVETAAPTHVVLTFPSAKTDLVASDFTIIGFSIASASWTGAVLTIILTQPVYVFHENLSIVFERTGQTGTITNNVTDEVTAAWYDMTDESTIIKNESNVITGGVKNKLGVAASDLSNVLGTPEWSATEGVICAGSGTTGAGMKTGPFTLNQPTSIYTVMNWKSYSGSGSDFAFDGNVVYTGKLEKSSTNGSVAGAGTNNLINNNFTLDTFHVVRILFNGTGSKLNISKIANATNNAGTANMGGFTHACRGDFDADTRYGHTHTKETILRSGTDDAHEESIIRYLWYKYFKTFNSGKLVISFDDGTSADYAIAYPLLKSKGVAATFYLISNEVDNEGNITWEQAKIMSDDGMDMQCHTHTHPDLRTLTEEEVVAQLTAVNNEFIAAGLPVPLHIAYPQGYYNDDVKSYVSGLRRTGRSASAPVAALPSYYRNSDKFALNAANIGGMDAAAMTALKLRIDWLADRYLAGVVFSHRLDAVGSVTSAQLEEIIDYAILKGVEIVTMKQLYAQMDH